MKHFMSMSLVLPLDVIEYISDQADKHDLSLSDEVEAIVRADIKARECSKLIMKIDPSLSEEDRSARICNVLNSLID